ncbi:DUF4294 domain-containing protein [uncultured Maribacter sp.]|uniref:DUF4294 domain-containing protein n=1 Tax=uncultured Maribacter sp. TaxID=431308 RepID=UPI002628AEE6|nr:DUF4294 domain-containing protein [uncultured Maribacter sp.]
MKKIFLFFIVVNIAIVVSGQAQEQQNDSIPEKFIKVEGDSIFQSSIPLHEAYVFGKLKFDNYDAKLKYYILRRKTIKVYPYAKLAAERLVELNDTLLQIKKKGKRKKYTKEVQKSIEDEFSEKLKKLTRTEGQILVKLVHRQTGNTSFDLVKDLRSGWRAFWYNTTAGFFNITIKAEYDPVNVHEDYLIEDILQRAFAAGKLERQESVLDYEYGSLINKWKGTSTKKNN